jgi:ribosome maturation factor RimP
MPEMEATIEERLTHLDSEVELVLLERPSRESLRLVVDHPDGVDLGLCERVTASLRDLLADYSIEVSSPGSDRPLTKLEHYRRHLGRAVRISTHEAIDGRRNFTGTLTGADEAAVRLEIDGRAVAIPLDRIRRSNLVPELQEVHG